MARLWQEVRYAFTLIFHPFNGFWDIKHEKRGGMRAMWVFLAAVILVRIFSRQLTGYLFNSNDTMQFNFFLEIAQVLVLFLLWCTANWCLTSLMDGEGSFKDICIATSYALVPYILIQFPLILVSNILSGRESAFYEFFVALSLIWSGALLVFGVMVTHQYSLLKTVLTVAFTVAGMAMIVFIALLLINLVGQMAGFAVNMYRELTFRQQMAAIGGGLYGLFMG